MQAVVGPASTVGALRSSAVVVIGGGLTDGHVVVVVVAVAATQRVAQRLRLEDASDDPVAQELRLDHRPDGFGSDDPVVCPQRDPAGLKDACDLQPEPGGPVIRKKANANEP